MVRAIKLLKMGGRRNKSQPNHCFHRENGFRHKKCIFLEKRGCGYQPLTLEPPLPDEQRRSNGTPDGPDGSGNADRQQRDVRIKSEVNEAGRAKEVRAHPVTFVSTLFEIISI
jgi:hypothetical protein